MVSFFVQISPQLYFQPNAIGCNQVQNRQRVTEFSETYLRILKQVSKRPPFLGDLAYILSTYKKRNRLKLMILSGYEENEIV
jgi:hypothetical protein